MINVYEKPTCTTCKKMIKLLNEKGYEFERINYYVEPFSKKKLIDLLNKMNITPNELIRTKEALYKNLEIKTTKYTDEELIDLMVKYPDLVQRPIVEIDDKAVLGRPVEKILEIL